MSTQETKTQKLPLFDIYRQWAKGGYTSDFRAFIDSFKDYSEYQMFIDSDIRFTKFLREDYFIHDGKMYDSDDYVLSRDGDVLHIDDANLCQYYDEYTSEDIYLCNIGRHEYYYCESAINKHDLFMYRGEYYDYDALYMNDLCEIDGDIYPVGECYYYDDEWHLDPDSREDYTRDYHDNRFQEKVSFTKNPKFYIGIEIEKEDVDVKESIMIHDFEDECPNYRKERDGSLDDYSGFELITPPYELKPKSIIDAIKSNQILLNHINADISKNCGGHVNLSEEGMTGEELFDKIKGYTPLLNALYYKRIDKSYCKGKSNDELKSEKAKYQSIRIHSNRVEFRMVSAVKNIDVLEWRLRLFELIVKNPTECPIKAFYNIHSKFKSHLRKVYKNNFSELNDRIIDMTKTFENITITSI